MSEHYIKSHFDDIKKYADVIEKRLSDDITKESVLKENQMVLESAKKHGVNYILIDSDYHIDMELESK